MVLAGCGASIALAAAPAGASNTEMTGVGSFTTYFMMHNLFPEINLINPTAESGSETQSIASDSLTCSGGITYNTTVIPPNGSGAGKTALAAQEASTVAANEKGCLDFSRSSSPPGPATETLPSSSTETGDPTPSNLDYYAYALDGVAPVAGTFAPSTAFQPGTGNGLTLAQVQSIYECVTTNWDQLTIDGVTGTNSPIVTFWPQKGSGTRAVYTDILGFDPTKPGVGPDTCTTSDTPILSFQSGASAVIPYEENTEDGILYQNTVGVAAGPTIGNPTSTAVPIGSVAKAAIYIYSAGKFSSEWNDTADNNSTADNIVKQQIDGSATPDNTLGNFLAGTLNMVTVQNTSGNAQGYVDLTPQAGKFNQDTNRGTYAMDGNTVSEANEWYTNLPGTDSANPSISNTSIPGVRFVYNIADTQLPSYDGAKLLIGFDNQSGGTRSTLCNGDDASTITTSGFLPLTNSSPSNGSNANGSFCREFAGLVFPGQGTAIHWTTPTFDSRDH